MASTCDIIAGRKEECKNSQGGIRAIYVATAYISDLMTDFTFTDEVVTAMTTPIQAFKFELKGANGMEEENTNSRENGTSFVTQTLTAILKKQDSVTQKGIKLLTYGRPQIIVEDYNGNYRIMGIENGVEVAVNTSTGQGMGDLNGYTLTGIASEADFAFYIDATLIDTVAGVVVTEGTN
jgi:hypothetical protein